MTDIFQIVERILKKRSGRIDIERLEKELFKKKALGFGMAASDVVFGMVRDKRVKFDSKNRTVELIGGQKANGHYRSASGKAAAI